MAIVSEQYQKMVLDDLKNYGSLRRFREAGLLERLLVSEVPVRKLHPNPEDEFCNPEIGPNGGIIGKYEQEIVFKLDNDLKPVLEPVVVQKVTSGGYMLLNGHHRWMAAARVGLKRIPVQIVNLTDEEKIIRAVKASERELCASFDLDEVLLTDGTKRASERALPFPMNLAFKHSVRKDIGVLMTDLQQNGFDIWVYTGSYASERYVRALLGVYHARISGVMNGLGKRKANPNVRQAFRKKYRLSFHVDNDSVLCVDTRTKHYETVQLSQEGNWANEVMSAVNRLTEQMRDGE